MEVAAKYLDLLGFIVFREQSEYLVEESCALVKLLAASSLVGGDNGRRQVPFW